MTPDERLERIVEQQRELKSRLFDLEQELNELRLVFRERRDDPAPPPAPMLPFPAKVQEAPGKDKDTVPAPVPVQTPPPLPKNVIQAASSALPKPASPPQSSIAKPEESLSKAGTDGPVRREASPMMDQKVKDQQLAPQAAAPVGMAPKGDLEMRLGKVWFVRIGIVAILTGVALGSVYAYQNFIRHTPPIFKVLALYGVSAALAGLGLWLERSRESLKTFGRVITAGGFAALFYTTYAMHYVERLRVIENPVLAGMALLVCALGIFLYADRRKDQTVAAMSLVLGYYGTVINAIGWFSLFSNLLLTLGGLWLLWRHRWIALGVLSLVGSYGGFAFWQYALPLVTTGGLASLAYWAGQGFLMSCWLLFTAAFLLTKADAMGMRWRGTLLTLNNSAFFALFTVALIFRTEIESRSDAFAVFAMTWGIILLLLCWLAEWRHQERGRPLGEMFLAFGLVQISLAFVVKFSGYNLATVFAFQAAVLAWLGNRQDRVVAKVGSALSAFLVLALPLYAVPGNDGLVSQVVLGTTGATRHAGALPILTGAQMVAVVIQILLLLAGGWYARKVLSAQHKNHDSISVLSFWLCLAAMLTAFTRLTVPGRELSELLQALGVTALFIVAGGERLLRFVELRRVGTLAALICAVTILIRAFMPHATEAAFFNSVTISLCAVALLTLAWLSRQDAWMKVLLPIVAGSLSLEVFTLGAVAWVSWVKVVVLPMQQWWDAPVLMIASGVLYLLGNFKKAGLLDLSPVARLAGLVSGILIGVAAYKQRSQMLDGWEYVGALAASMLLIVAAWLARHKPAFPWTPVQTGFGFVPLVHSLAAVGSFVLLAFWPFMENWQPGGWIVICALVMAASKLKKVCLPELGIVAGVFALFMSYHQITTLLTSSDRIADAWLLLAFVILMLAAAMPAPSWPEKEKLLPLLRWAAGLQTTFSYLHWWLMHEPQYFSLATAVVGLLLAALANRKHIHVAAAFAWLMLCLSLLSFIADAYGFGPAQQWWAWLVPVSIMGSEWLLRHSRVYTENVRKAFNNSIALAAVFALWSYITFSVLAEGEFRTIAWAVLALLVFTAGILMGHAIYRRCGLAVLAVAMGRIIFYDVWQLETAGRFISFLAIGAVLVLLGFFYNRFEDFIRKYL